MTITLIKIKQFMDNLNRVDFVSHSNNKATGIVRGYKFIDREYKRAERIALEDLIGTWEKSDEHIKLVFQK